MATGDQTQNIINYFLNRLNISPPPSGPVWEGHPGQVNPQWLAYQGQLQQITSFANTLLQNQTLITAAKTVNNRTNEQDAWWDIYGGVGQSGWDTYANNLMDQYGQITGRKEDWEKQSKVAGGTGRMPTILTSGRGVRGSPTLAFTKLKKQLGK